MLMSIIYRFYLIFSNLVTESAALVTTWEEWLCQLVLNLNYKQDNDFASHKIITL